MLQGENSPVKQATICSMMQVVKRNEEKGKEMQSDRDTVECLLGPRISRLLDIQWCV